MSRARRVAIVGDGTKPTVRAAVEEARAWISELLQVVEVDLDGRCDLAALEADLMLSFGGDGTILQTARRMGAAQKPVAGVNFGKLGFLADLVPETLREDLEGILAEGLPVEPRMMLVARLVTRTGSAEEFLALNDVVITRAALNRMTDVRLRAGGEDVATYHGDGLIVATPVGSTAHSLSAGGPIVHQGMRALLVTPICPHTLSNRPLVVSADLALEMEAGSANPAALTIDGQETRALTPGDRVTVEAAPFDFLQARVRRWTYFRVLRQKLRWGTELDRTLEHTP